MWIKKKLSREILVLLAVSILISVFLFAFLQNTSASIGLRYLASTGKADNHYLTEILYVWTQGVSLLASALFFVVLFLFLLGQKLLYLQEITSGIEALRTHRMDYTIPVEGDNELTELARRINYLSRTEQELLQKEASLVAEREQFIRSIAHDIRTPITSVMAYSELLAGKEHRTKEEIDAYIDLNLRKGQQMKELMERLLENKAHRTEYFQDGQLLLRQLADDWEEVLSERFQVHTDWSGCSPFSGSFDVQEMLRVFDNLLTNIQKYADPARPVCLQVSVSENRLHLRQMNFIRPVRAEVESHQLGLETISRIISRYNGSVSVRSTGQEFHIDIEFPINL